MNEKFFDLKKEKQDRMINAALKVFALNGYRHASTDDIVREAAISKGLLFHYFENKLCAVSVPGIVHSGRCEGDGSVHSDAAGGDRENACHVRLSLSAAVPEPGTGRECQ